MIDLISALTAILAIGLAIASVIDVRTRRLPDWLVLPLMIVGLLGAHLVNPSALLPHLLAALLGFLAFYLIANLYRRLRGYDGLGLGDAKLIAAAGARLGPLHLAPVVFVGAVLALVAALILRLLGRNVSLQMTLRFGPFLSVGFLAFGVSRLAAGRLFDDGSAAARRIGTRLCAQARDVGGRLLSRTYPDGSGSGTFAYNAAGQMTTLSGAITGTTYAADGQIRSTSYVNGVATTYAYSSTRGWLSSISAVNGATTIESLNYGRDAAGRITSVTGGRPDESWTYGYDAFDQLLSAANTNTPSLSRSYTYDVGGNLSSNSAVGTYSYPTQGATTYQPHAATSAGNWTFGYDLKRQSDNPPHRRNTRPRDHLRCR